MYIGKPLKRVEDNRFLRGRGTYVDDVTLPDMTFAAFVRSPHAHAVIRNIFIDEALAIPGVVNVLTGEDWSREGRGRTINMWPVKNSDGSLMHEISRPILTVDRVRFVGDTLAVVIAEDPQTAKDGVDAVVVDYEPMLSVVDADVAIGNDAPILHDSFGTNLAFDWDDGDKAAIDKAFSVATHVTTLELTANRLAPAYIEARAALGQYDSSSGHYTLWVTSQAPHLLRRSLAESSLCEPEHKIRVIAPDMGGGFGPKIDQYTEEAVVLWASKIVDRPVRWSSSRSECFAVDSHARDHITKCKMAFDQDGKILGIQSDSYANLGAYLSIAGAGVPSMVYASMLPGMYTTPVIYARVRGAYTNTTPVEAYRGAGRPESLFVVERLLENGAREMGIDVCEIRARNLIQAEQFPYMTPTGNNYDSGDPPSLLRKIKQNSNYERLRIQQTELRGEGVFMGIGMSVFMDSAGFGPSKMLGASGMRYGMWDSANVRIHPTGKVTVFCGGQNHGQGHETVFAQVAAEKLGLDFADVEIVEGDTDRVQFGMGTHASRSMTVVGSAVAIATERVIEKASRLAAHLLECAPQDIDYADGEFVVKGTDRKMSFAETAKQAYYGADYPEDFELGLEETSFFDPPDYNFPSAMHLCTVIVDAETGLVQLGNYFCIDDVGLIINPMILKGQIHGGLAQGIGQALMEHVVYNSESGQLLSGTFMDYSMPRAMDMPELNIDTTQETLSPNNPLGVKGAGESGTIGAPACVGNAVVDALWHLGVHHVEMPMTPERVLSAIQAAGG